MCFMEHDSNTPGQESIESTVFYLLHNLYIFSTEVVERSIRQWWRLIKSLRMYTRCHKQPVGKSKSNSQTTAQDLDRKILFSPQTRDSKVFIQKMMVLFRTEREKKLKFVPHINIISGV